MKKKFHGHFKPTDAKFKRLWNNCIFAFDANILLNLYRYSDNTRRKLFDVLETLSDRVWLPHQAAEEYFSNRISTTSGQVNEYAKVQKEIDKLLAILGNTKRHPFISDSLYEQLKNLSDKINVEFKKNEEQLNNRINKDDILEKISKIFDGKIGEQIEQTELDEIYQKGKIRYEAEIPPGFRDGNKDKSSNLYRKYGDLIIWNELKTKAKNDAKNFIFITDDKKDDWWLEYNGKTISPLPYLIQEFKSETKQDFHMYTADRFVEAATKYGKENIDTEVIEELKEFRMQELVLQQLLVDNYKSKLENLKFDTFINSINISDERIDDKIKHYLYEYSKEREGQENSFIGLKHFVTVYLSERGLDVNNSYAALNKLNEKGLIEIYDKKIGNYLVKAIRINEHCH